MSYQVLARKWRPRTFSELVGQEHVARALINGLDNDRLHHAFLFTGTRGVGKTTIARIFAKALNCETGVSSEPCGECGICREVDDGRFVDLIEVDAASRTKVDDTRELLDNVQYAPGRGRFKVYLIDEVHMLSTHSFNALLKTLEEPPPHVKFLLATTDPQKLPVTVLSRCLQFNLKRLEPEQIRGYLERVLVSEQVDFEPGALEAIAVAADGSMRDSLSLMDQAIAFGGGALTDAEVRSMLGTIDREHVERLLTMLADENAAGLWQAIDDLASYAPDYGAVLRDLASVLHEAAVCQVVPRSAPDAFTTSLAERTGAEDLQLAYEIAVQGRATLELAPNPRTGFEMALLRMLAFRPATQGSSSPASDGGGPARATRSQGDDARARAREIAGLSSATAQRPPPTSRRKSVAEAEPRPPVAADTQLVSANAPSRCVTRLAVGETPRREIAPPDGPGESEAPDMTPPAVSDWNKLFTRLGLRGPAAILAANSVLETVGAGHYQLIIDPGQAHLRTPSSEDKIRVAITRLFGTDARVDFAERSSDMESPAASQAREAAERQLRAREAIEADPVVADLRRELGATLIVDSIRPLDN